MKYILFLLSFFMPLWVYSGPCDYPDQRDSAGRRCGGRAASVIPGGRLGGDGRYTDSLGRDRVYGRDNDPYDAKPKNIFNNNNQNQQNNPFSF